MPLPVRLCAFNCRPEHNVYFIPHVIAITTGRQREETTGTSQSQ